MQYQTFTLVKGADPKVLHIPPGLYEVFSIVLLESTPDVADTNPDGVRVSSDQFPVYLSRSPRAYGEVDLTRTSSPQTPATLFYNASDEQTVGIYEDGAPYTGFFAATVYICYQKID